MKLRRKKHGLQESGIPYVLPALLVVASVMLFPLLYNIVLSFFKKTIYDMNWSFVGLAQYKKLLTSDIFLNALKNTVIWTVVSVFFQFLIGFICALVISQDRIRFRGIWRCLIMLAWVLPSVIGSMVWKWMYHSDFGILNEILLRLGLIKQALAWTGSKQLALTSAIIVNVWKLFPLVLMYIEAALQSVPRSLEDAAVVDGANTWRCFTVVTWPHIRPTCITVILLLTIWTLKRIYVYLRTDRWRPRHGFAGAVDVHQQRSVPEL